MMGLKRVSRFNHQISRFMSDAESDSDDMVPLTPQQIDQQKKMFDMNRSVKLGRSKDQDGKSNIW